MRRSACCCGGAFLIRGGVARRLPSRQDGIVTRATIATVTITTASVEDIGATNGTFVNGIRLTRERRLAPGDVVIVGETYLRFES